LDCIGDPHSAPAVGLAVRAVLSNGTNGWPLVACLEFKIARDRLPVRLHETLGPPSDAPFCGNGCLVDQKPIVGNRNGASQSTIETFDQSLGLWLGDLDSNQD
jgi:hypothetical protein